MPYPLKTDVAVAHRTELAIERGNVQRAGAVVDEAKGAFLPVLEASISLDHMKTYDPFPGVALTAHYGGAAIPGEVQGVNPAYQMTTAIELRYNPSGGDRTRLSEAPAVEKAVRAQQELAKKNRS